MEQSSKRMTFVTGHLGYIAASLERVMPFNCANDKSCFTSLNIPDGIIVHLAEKKLQHITKDNKNQLVRLHREFLKTKEDKRLVYASSCSVYGNGELCDENTPINPTTHYAEVKAEVEAMIRETIPDHVIYRFGTIFGLNDRTRYDLLLNDMVAHRQANKTIEIYDSESIRPYLHVEDAAYALKFATESDFTGTYNVVAGNSSKRLLAQIIGCETKLVNKTDPRNYRALAYKIEEVGFLNTHTLKSGIQQMLYNMSSSKN